MASQTLAVPALTGSLDEIQDAPATRAGKPFLHRLMDFIVTTQTHRAQRAIAMHLRSRGLEFTPLDAQQPPH
jgi:hypothetical protein